MMSPRFVASFKARGCPTRNLHSKHLSAVIFYTVGYERVCMVRKAKSSLAVKAFLCYVSMICVVGHDASSFFAHACLR